MKNSKSARPKPTPRQIRVGVESPGLDRLLTGAAILSVLVAIAAILSVMR